MSTNGCIVVLDTKKQVTIVLACRYRVDFDDGRQESYDTVLCATGRQ